MSKMRLVCLYALFVVIVSIAVARPVHASVQLSSTSLNFGSVNVNSSSAPDSVLVTNAGRRSVTLESITSSASQFLASGITLPATIAPHASVTFHVVFSPNAAQSYSGTIRVQISTRYQSSASIAVSGTGVAAQLVPKISVVPNAASFGSVTTGVTNTQPLSISNGGTGTLTITQATISGAGFALSGLNVPLNIAPGGSSACTVSFDPGSAGSRTGTLTLANNSATPSVTVPLSGTGVAAVLQLSVSPSSVSFGNVTTGMTATNTVAVKNTGNANVSISKDSVTGAGFAVAGMALPVTLTPAQSASFTVEFAPSSTGSVSGSVSISSNASNSPTTVALAGSGVAPAAHTVLLSWTPSSSSYSGFNIYRSTTAGGPYAKIDVSLITTDTYTDRNVSSGQTYYYVATEVSTGGAESGYSNQVSVTIP